MSSPPGWAPPRELRVGRWEAEALGMLPGHLAGRRLVSCGAAAEGAAATARSLTHELRALGLGPGRVVLVHSSLRALGPVRGGAQAVVEALLASVAPGGTIVMPAQSGQLRDPATRPDPPAPEQLDAVRAEMPAYDRRLTPTQGMGAIVECFRTHPDTHRSAHPTMSFVANGALAEAVLAEHPLTPAVGEGSPLARLHELDADVLLVGVDHSVSTSLHLAEHRARWPGKATRRERLPSGVHGEQRWVLVEDLATDGTDFGRIGERHARDVGEARGPVGATEGRVCSQRSLVDFAVRWMSRHRG